MKLLSNKFLNDEFYDTEMSDSPITRDQMKDIVYHQFENVKKEITSGSLCTIRLKYFGIFVVYFGRAKAILNRTAEHYEKGTITKELFERRSKMIKDYLNENEIHT